MSATILVADDDRSIRLVVSQALTQRGHAVRAAADARTLWQWVDAGEGDLVVTDVLMPDGNGLDLVPRIKERRPNLPIIVMSAQNTILTAIRANERGAFEYLPKPFDLDVLVAAVDRALTQTQAEAPPAGDGTEEALPIVGRSPAMQEVFRVIGRLVNTDMTALVNGESGTGKELVARALHDFGRRKDKPFVAINMAAIPRELIESELFGHEKGAFTGAISRGVGKFELAQGGTLFLDEIGDMPMEAQTRLLRVLQTGEFTSVGGRAPQQADVRIIAATHRDLRQLIAQGRFREDLFYRLNVVPIHLPALRERRADITDLARHFLIRAALDGLASKTLSAGAIEELQRYDWPGNVRELENLMRRIAVLYSESVIDARMVAESLAVDATGRDGKSGGRHADETLGQSVDRHLRAYFAAHQGRLPARGLYDRILQEIERPLLTICLEATRGNQIKAAELLGLNRNTLRKKLRELENPREAARNRRMTEAAFISIKKANLSRRLFDWSRQINLERRIAMMFLALAAISGLLTYLVLTDVWKTQNPARAITWLLLADFIIVLSLGTIIARRFVVIWIERRRGLVGAKLHSRLVLLFGLIALIPAITVSVFSTTFLNYGLDIWFGDKIKAAVESSEYVSQSYLQDHQQRIANDTLSIANEIRDQDWQGFIDLSRLDAFLDRQVDLRDLSEAVVIDRRRQILASGGFSLMMEFDLELPEDAMVRADSGDTVILHSPAGDRVRALVAIDLEQGIYLYAGRVIDDKVLSAIRGNENAVSLYRQLEGDRSQWQITVGLIFAVLALLLLMAAIWVAIISATNLVKPITRLVEAAQRLGGGDLSARVKAGRRDDELGELSRTFNTMALRLQTQQVELVATNQQLDDRRRFTELVLSGVSAGVISLDEKGEIELPNRSASELLGRNMMEHIGQRLEDLVPEMGELVRLAQSRPAGSADGQINMSHGPVTRTLHVRVVSERGEGDHTRIVVTFDDVTELLSAQRKAAWSDIARRIAHEIKNPLTPIQLSAERLKRKYLKEIVNDPETFAICTDTIVRQVGDIGRLVDEFSSFARMPAPVLRPEDLVELARQAAFLQQSANPAIAYDIDLPAGAIWVNCDASQVTRALTNLLQNAADAIETRLEQEASSLDGDAQNRLTPGRIHLWIRRDGDQLVLAVDDNGRGFPRQGRERLTDPYVTTRIKGTGLGLAIVKKIMEDHGGRLQLLDGETGGASVRLTFPAEIVLADPALKSVQA